MNLYTARIRCSPLFFLLAAFAAVSGNLGPFLIYLVAVLLHECAHGIMTRMLGCTVDCVNIMPYGCAAEISGMASWADELAIAAAGPIFSLIAFWGCRDMDHWAAAEFAQANMYIAMVNLLPAYPLDGGRAVGAMLRMMDIRPPLWLRRGLPLSFGAALMVLGVAAGNITFMVFGGFLGISAVKLMAGGTAGENYMRRMRTISSGRAAAVRHVAIAGDAAISTALMYANGSSYVVFCVLDKDMKEMGRIDCVHLAEQGARLGCDTKIGDALAMIDPMR